MPSSCRCEDRRGRQGRGGRAAARVQRRRQVGGHAWAMSGFYEGRTDGANRHHYRLFCMLERNGAQHGLGGPSLVLITGKDKPFRTLLSAVDYDEVRALGRE